MSRSLLMRSLLTVDVTPVVGKVKKKARLAVRGDSEVSRYDTVKISPPS